MDKSFFKKASLFQFASLFLSLTALAGALWSQTAFNLYPCTYCIVARYVMSFIAIFSMLGLLFSIIVINTPDLKLRHQSLLSKISFLFSFIVVLNVLFGLYISVKHYIVVFNNNFSCGRDALQEYLNNLFLAKMWPSMYEATGNCVDANYKLFGIIDYVHLPMFIYISTLIFMIFYFLNYFKFFRRIN